MSTYTVIKIRPKNKQRNVDVSERRLREDRAKVKRFERKLKRENQ